MGRLWVDWLIHAHVLMSGVNQVFTNMIPILTVSILHQSIQGLFNMVFIIAFELAIKVEESKLRVFNAVT